MKTLGWLLCCVSSFALGGCTRHEPIFVTVYANKKAELKIPANFKGAGLNGETIALENYLGKVVLLDFWATTCAPCVRQLPALTRVHQKYHGQGFEVVGISMDENIPRLRSFMRSRQMSWPQITDPQGLLTNSTVPDGHGIPMVALFARNGQLVAADLNEAELEAAVKAELAKAP